MSSMSSLSIAVSGLRTNQQALQSTAHNLANVNTPGYVRQQTLMQDSFYHKIGNNGSSNMMIGMGTDIQSLRQVRDMFLDGAYRNETSRCGYYSSGAESVTEIETILGEIEGESMGDVLKEFFASLNELSKHPDGREARGTFVQSAVLFVNKSNLIMEQFNEYQLNLNKQVIDNVDEINKLGEEIYKLNKQIVKYEINGDNANDYRDARNYALDKLSKLISISYSEDRVGNVTVMAEGNSFISVDGVSKISLEQSVPKSPLVSPIWAETGNRVFDLKTEISAENNNDKGSLKGLVIARGHRPANWTDTQDSVEYNKNIKPSIIMRAQAKFDLFVHEVVSKVNDIIAPKTKGPDSPFGLDGTQSNEIFKRKYMDRYSGAVYQDEDKTDLNSLYSAGNLEINPDILNDYDKICITKDLTKVQENDIVESIIDKLDEASIREYPGSDAKLNVNNYYISFVGEIGNFGESARTQMDNQLILVSQIDNQRSSYMGVSSDEELGNMMKYQHAYNASARVVTVLDQMLDQIVNKLGLVGR